MTLDELEGKAATQTIGSLIDKSLIVLDEMNRLFGALYDRGFIGVLTIGNGTRENFLSVSFQKRLPEVKDE